MPTSLFPRSWPPIWKNIRRDEHQQEIQELLVDSYITSRNFEGAMELLEKNKGYASKETYQKVAFYRGVELVYGGRL